MEIVISGYYGFDNVGDEAILASIIETLRREHPTISITVLSNQPKKTIDVYKVKAVNRWDITEVFKAIKQSDGVISGGGGLLQDSTGSKSIPYYCGVMWLAYLLKKPFFVYAQGIGPIKRTLNKKIVSFTLKKALLITVRDHLSKEYIHHLGIKKDVSVVADPVLALKIDTTYSDWLKKELNESPYLAVTVRSWTKNSSYHDKFAGGLSTLAEKGLKIVFVPMHGKDDAQCSEKVKEKMTSIAQRNTIIAPEDLSIQEKANIIGTSELLIGMRLHSLIFAAIQHIPFLAISYDPKIDSFTKLCGQKLIGHVDDPSWDSTFLLNEINNGLATKTSLIDKIRSYTEKAQDSAEITATLIINQLLSRKTQVKHNLEEIKMKHNIQNNPE